METISILGTGWLGFSLAKVCQKNFEVKVSARNIEKQKKLKDEGFYSFILNEEDYSNLDDLLSCDYLFINFPPSKSKNYLKFLETIYNNKKLENIKKIFFISSSSIYPKVNNIYTEEFKIDSPSSKIVFDAENLIKNKTQVIFRCTGLMGDNRIAGKYFAGKTTKGANAKVNYVHKNDVINATLFAIENDLEGIFNLCSSSHPTRYEVYISNAIKYGFEKPNFEGALDFEARIISGSKIEEKGFRYKYPNPLNFDY